MQEFCCYFWKRKSGSKAHWHVHETAILTWHCLFPMLAMWHIDLFSLFLCCFLRKSQPLWLLMRQGWQLKNPDAKLWIVCLLGLWLVSSLASALALQQAVLPSVEPGSGLVFCWIACSSGHCLPFKLPLIMRNVCLSCRLHPRCVCSCSAVRCSPSPAQCAFCFRSECGSFEPHKPNHLLSARKIFKLNENTLVCLL